MDKPKNVKKFLLAFILSMLTLLAVMIVSVLVSGMI
jgi:hypothetical protein